MKGRRRGRFTVLAIAFILLFAAQCVALLIYNQTFFIIALAIFTVLVVAAIICYNGMRRALYRDIMASAEMMTDEKGNALKDFSAPVVILSKGGRVVWHNKAFATLAQGENVLGSDFATLIGENAYSKLVHFKNTEGTIFNRIFEMFILNNNEVKVVYFVDQTELKKTAAEYRFSRPVAALLEIDSLEQILSDVRDSKKAQICGEIQDIVEKWFTETNGIMRTISNSRYLLIFEQRYLKQFEDEKFKILELVRNYQVADGKSLTLSVGIGHGCKTLHECESLAKKALDMSLSRGGDQVAIKSPKEDYRFYGGVKAVAEKGSRVRARITANALLELITASERVVIMGHRFSDLDCVGASVALAQTIQELDVPVDIVLNRNESMASALLEYTDNNGLEDIIISGQDILEAIDENTLLIVVDTHRPSVLDCKEVFEKASRVVVIDHHRKATDYIDNAVIFYDETVASSTCEMVAELCQYISSAPLNRIQANALLSGIMLDTKNFILNTGVRTFEAAAYLRKCGADPVLVKKMFADSVDIYKKKYAVISSAQIYEDCVIALNPETDKNTRLISKQAADELLNVNHVKASFVLFMDGENVNVSARSLGEINVQVIMEKLGGGGHRTMAACSIKNATFETALTALQEAIDSER
ncbi:MAG: DHH family phosphoesterase [Clostridia bacterium]|nr:DHH family phosphoesterase [Clostridia bacterium]